MLISKVKFLAQGRWPNRVGSLHPGFGPASNWPCKPNGLHGPKGRYEPIGPYEPREPYGPCGPPRDL